MSPLSYGEVLADLAGATGRLVPAGPRRAGDRMEDSAADRTLACRDLLISELRAFTGLLVGARSNPEQPMGLPDVVANPVHVLTEGLGAMPAAAPPGRAPSEVLAGERDDWTTAAAAAVALEAFGEPALRLAPRARWAALADIAELAAAVAYLDADLAARLPAGHEDAAAVLVDPVAHGLVRLSAGELRLQLRGLDTPGYLHQLDRAPTAPVVLRSPADLPDGMRRLTAALRQVGPGIADVDVRAVLRVLEVGAAATLRQNGPFRVPDRTLHAVRAAQPELRHVRAERLATLARPDPRIAALTTEVYGQLHRLPGTPTVAGATATVAWLRAAASTSEALHSAVRAAAATDRLLTRPDGYQTRAQEHLAWLPLPAEVAPHHPAITGLANTARQLDTARSALLFAAGADTAGKAAHAAALAAGRAVRELRAALNNRSPQQLPQPQPLPTRPAQQRPVQPPSTEPQR